MPKIIYRSGRLGVVDEYILFQLSDKLLNENPLVLFSLRRSQKYIWGIWGLEKSAKSTLSTLVARLTTGQLNKGACVAGGISCVPSGVRSNLTGVTNNTESTGQLTPGGFAFHEWLCWHIWGVFLFSSSDRNLSDRPG